MIKDIFEEIKRMRQTEYVFDRLGMNFTKYDKNSQRYDCTYKKKWKFDIPLINFLASQSELEEIIETIKKELEIL